MKIGIEGQRLLRAQKHGMDFVALEIIKEMQRLDKENDYLVFVRPDEDRSCLHSTANFKIKEVPGHSYPSWENCALTTAARNEGVDLLHCTSNTAPLMPGSPLVLTVHDIIYLERMSLFDKRSTLYQRWGNMYRRLVVPRAVKNSRKIITVSNYEKKRIVDSLRLADDRVEVVYNGVGNHFRQIKDRHTLKSTRAKYGLPTRFAFFLGNTDPKKNVEGVVKAFALFLEKSKSKLSLVIADYKKEDLHILLDQLGFAHLSDYFCLPGYIQNHDLSAIYNLCQVFLYPSLRESFGMPILEAMACGCPVITSTTSSMPEVAGNAALLVDPAQPAQIADALMLFEANDATKKENIQKGLHRVKKFTWSKVAESVLGIYHQAAAAKDRHALSFDAMR